MIGPATADDRAAVVALLESCRLPVEDLPASLDDFLVARQGPRLVGAIGLERHGAQALLRSLAVAEDHRGLGLATELWRRIRQHAVDTGVEELFLLTDSAEAIFSRWGWRRLPREEAPAMVTETPQFRGLCPSSAALMAFRLPY